MGCLVLTLAEGFGARRADARARGARVAAAGEVARLRDEAARRTKDLQTAVAGLRGLERTREELLSNVSHDLKNPLTAIKAYLEMLARPTAGRAHRAPGEGGGDLPAQRRPAVPADQRAVAGLAAASREDAAGRQAVRAEGGGRRGGAGGRRARPAGPARGAPARRRGLRPGRSGPARGGGDPRCGTGDLRHPGRRHGEGGGQLGRHRAGAAVGHRPGAGHSGGGAGAPVRQLLAKPSGRRRSSLGLQSRRRSSDSTEVG